MHACIHVFIARSLHACMHAYLFACMHACLFACMHACLYACVCVACSYTLFEVYIYMFLVVICLFFLGAWQAGLLGTLEKARASPGDTQRYLLCWPVKLLRCPQPVAVLRDAERLLVSQDDEELASKNETDVLLHQPKHQQGQQQQQGQQLLCADEQQQHGEEDVLEGLDTLEAVDAFCNSFEERHSLQVIWWALPLPLCACMHLSMHREGRHACI